MNMTERKSTKDAGSTILSLVHARARVRFGVLG
jgi:hypothetical protein